MHGPRMLTLDLHGWSLSHTQLMALLDVAGVSCPEVAPSSPGVCLVNVDASYNNLTDRGGPEGMPPPCVPPPSWAIQSDHIQILTQSRDSVQGLTQSAVPRSGHVLAAPVH